MNYYLDIVQEKKKSIYILYKIELNKRMNSTKHTLVKLFPKIN